MPGTKKKPMANGRKKVTASARARISTRKVRKVVNAGLGESYTQQTVSREASNNATTLRCYNSPFLNCMVCSYQWTAQMTLAHIWFQCHLIYLTMQDTFLLYQ